MFTCYRAKQVSRALGILDIVEEVTRIDRSGSIVLEEILRRSNNKSPVLGHVGLKELIVVGSWYLWWQRREFVKDAYVAPPARSAFRIQAIASEFGVVGPKAVTNEILWRKTPKNTYKLNVDASFSSDETGGA